MTAQMVTEYLAAGIASPQSEPCRECGTTGGYIPHDFRNPSRKRGYCGACYQRHQTTGTLTPQLFGSEGEMLWHTTAMVRQSHAVIPGYDYRAVIAEAEAFAARDLAQRPKQARPELNGAVFLFGEAA